MKKVCKVRARKAHGKGSRYYLQCLVLFASLLVVFYQLSSDALTNLLLKSYSRTIAIKDKSVTEGVSQQPVFNTSTSGQRKLIFSSSKKIGVQTVTNWFHVCGKMHRITSAGPQNKSMSLKRSIVWPFYKHFTLIHS